MHLAPGRSAWCLAQSNTNSGHGIPSKSLTAAEPGCRPAEQTGMRSNLPTLDSGKLGAGRVCLVGVTARLVGVELRLDRRIGGLHAIRYPLRSFLNRAQEEILGAPAGIQDQAEITLTRSF
jgi:hypothetical protein